MCIFHKWTKWEQYQTHMVFTQWATGKQVPHIEQRQKRHCKKCNLEQDKKVTGYE